MSHCAQLCFPDSPVAAISKCSVVFTLYMHECIIFVFHLQEFYCNLIHATCKKCNCMRSESYPFFFDSDICIENVKRFHCWVVGALLPFIIVSVLQLIKC